MAADEELQESSQRDRAVRYCWLNIAFTLPRKSLCSTRVSPTSDDPIGASGAPQQIEFAREHRAHLLLTSKPEMLPLSLSLKPAST
jgi:hypothetical protein